MRLHIRGHDWRRLLVSAFPDDDEQAGECDLDAKEIRILRGLPRHSALRIELHEQLHAWFPKASEKAVDEASTAMARLLLRLGWRKRA